MSRFTLIFLFFFVLSAPVQAVPVRAANGDAAYYHRAFSVIASGNVDQAQALAARGHDPVLNKVIRGYAMALPGNDYSFEQLSNFIADNPDWPGLKGIQMITEQKLPATMSEKQVVAWFTLHPPLTSVGFYRYIDALDQSGQAQIAQKVILSRWIEGSFSSDEQIAFFARFAALLDNTAIWARTDRLLWSNNTVEARRMIPYLNSTDRIVAGARLALGTEGPTSDWLDRVPSDAQNDPGILYQRLRWNVKNDRDSDAYALLLKAPSELGNAEAWWEQRNIMVRRAIEAHDFNLAYRLASNHGQTNPKPLVQAEFLSGWLALRFLNRPDLALQHFQVLYESASTPISRSRGSYWLGRTYEALGDREDAEKSYKNAAVFKTAFYGQLAATRLYDAPSLVTKADPSPPEPVRRAFFARDNIRAIERLAKISEQDRAQAFFRAAIDNAEKRADFILLTQLASRIRRPDLGIQTAKKANHKNILLENGGFPLITMRVPSPPEPAFTHALIRQESMFNTDATSSVGARGLMQLMPRTAKEVCKKIGVRYNEQRLDDPGYNMQLGTSFAAQQIERFDGSYILALAGYNAGPGRVRDWLDEFGDPRSPNVDPIDWIELIPMQETRNYVQRIIESLQVYRSKLAGGHSRMSILSDLKR